MENGTKTQDFCLQMFRPVDNTWPPIFVIGTFNKAKTTTKIVFNRTTGVWTLRQFVNVNVYVEETSSHLINIEETSSHYIDIEETSSHYITLWT